MDGCLSSVELGSDRRRRRRTKIGCWNTRRRRRKSTIGLMGEDAETLWVSGLLGFWASKAICTPCEPSPSGSQWLPSFQACKGPRPRCSGRRKSPSMRRPVAKSSVSLLVLSAPPSDISAASGALLLGQHPPCPILSYPVAAKAHSLVLPWPGQGQGWNSVHTVVQVQLALHVVLCLGQ